jgi:hypothetical protein
VSKLNVAYYSFGHLDFGHLILSFDVAQDGEPVEPFRVSDFGIRIFMHYSKIHPPMRGMTSKQCPLAWILYSIFAGG